MKIALSDFFSRSKRYGKVDFQQKRWLLSRSDLILSLKQDGMTNKQVIEHLKSAEKMPFDLDESLFSRHCKAILEQLDLKNLMQAWPIKSRTLRNTLATLRVITKLDFEKQGIEKA